MCYTITIKELRKRGILMAQRMRSNNKTITTIRMNNEVYDKMEELRALIDATRTEFIERAVYLLTVEINKEIEHGR